MSEEMLSMHKHIWRKSEAPQRKWLKSQIWVHNVLQVLKGERDSVTWMK